MARSISPDLDEAFKGLLRMLNMQHAGEMLDRSPRQAREYLLSPNGCPEAMVQLPRKNAGGRWLIPRVTLTRFLEGAS